MKQHLLIIGKYALLFVLSITTFLVGNLILPMVESGVLSGGLFILGLFINAALQVILGAILYYKINLEGFSKFIAIFVILFGLKTIVPQIEAIYYANFIPAITSEGIVNRFIVGFLEQLIFIPVAMRVLYVKRKNFRKEQVQIILPEVAKRTIRLSFLYVIIYFTVSYWIGWQFESVRMFYSGTNSILSFSQHLMQILHNSPGLIGLELLRGFLWILFVIPAIIWLSSVKKARFNTIFVLVSILPAATLLISNTTMPEDVRMIMFLEMLVAMVVYGYYVAKSMTNRKTGL